MNERHVKSSVARHPHWAKSADLYNMAPLGTAKEHRMGLSIRLTPSPARPGKTPHRASCTHNWPETVVTREWLRLRITSS